MLFFDLLIDALKIPVLLLILVGIGRFFYGEFTLKLKHSIVRNNFELIFGSIILFSIFAILKTNGKTVLSLVIFVLLIQYYFFNIRPKFSNLFFKKDDFFNLITISCVFLLFFTLQLYKYDYFNENIVHFGLDDYSFYSDTAERMLLSGNEQILEWRKIFTKYDFAYESKPSPYHYFELWIDAFLLSISRCNGIYIFLYLFFPFIGTLIFTSLFSFSLIFFEKVSRRKWISIFMVSLLFVFYIGKIPFKDGGATSYVFSHPRLFSFYIIFPLFIILQKLNLKIIAYISLSFLIYFNVLYTPTIIMTFFSLFILQQFILKKKEMAKYNIGLFLLNFFLIFLFYFILFKPNNQSKIIINYDQFFPILDYLKTISYNLIRLNFARIWFFYLPLTIFLGDYIYIKLKKKHSLIDEKNIVTILLYFISAFFAVSLPHSEKGTVHSIVLNPLLSIISLYGLLFILKRKKTITSYLIAFLFIIQAFYSFYFNLSRVDSNISYSSKFIHDIGKNFSVDNKIGAIISYIDTKSKSSYQYAPITCQYTSVLDIVGNGYVASFISVPLNENECPYDLIKPYITQAPFYKYGNFKRSREGIKDLAEIQKNYLLEYNIEYLIVAPEAEIPLKIEPLINKVFLDEISGLKIIILHQSNN